jgi:anti-anti-sigma factor
VRIGGRATFSASVDFKKLLLQLQSDGCKEIILDLKDCTLMDSTFLGVLAGAAMKCDNARQNGSKNAIELFQPSERILELIDNLGVLPLFTVLKETPQLGAFERVSDGKASRVELNRACFEAHKTLMEMGPDNERRFKDATEFFEKNLREDEGKE